jgi:ABC-2 type transport system permease protein
MTASIPTGARLTFGGVLRSEWIKLVTLRSTVWCYAILVVLTVGIGALVAALIGTTGDEELLGPQTQEAAQSTWLMVSTVGVGFAQLVIAVLGSMVITGEYGTGMIRSTFAAVPRRLPALVGKVLVFGVVSFLVALVALALTALLVVPLLAANDITVEIADPGVWRGILGAAGFVALIGLMALGIGAIIRNTAGAIAATLGLLLVLPTVLQIFGGLTRAEWALDATAFLPSSAGSQISTYPTEGFEAPPGVFVPLTLEPLEALVVLIAWAVVPLIIGAVLLKRRDS